MAEKIVSLSEISDALARGKKTGSKLRKAFDLFAREEAVYMVMGETDEQRFFAAKERPQKKPLSKLFGREAVYCTETAFTTVVAFSGLPPATKQAALEAAAAAPDHAPELAKGALVPYPRTIGFSG